MNEAVRRKCELFAENRKKIHSAFKWEWDMMSVVASLIFTDADVAVDIDRMKECAKLLESKAGIFSVFRSTERLMLVSKMALSNDPEKYFDDIKELYNKIKQGRILDDSYMILAAVVILDNNRKNDADVIIDRFNRILKGMSKVHPVITDRADMPMSMMLAMCDKEVDKILEDIETAYEYMKKNFRGYSNPTQSLAQVLSLTPGDQAAKCDKVIKVYEALRERGSKYGKEYEFASLGALIDVDMEAGALADEIVEADKLIASHRGFSVWNMDRATRLMFAAVLTAEIFDTDNTALSTSAIGGSLAIIVAEEIMLMMVVVMTTTSSTTH